MSDKSSRKSQRPEDREEQTALPPEDSEDSAVEEEPAVEWSERIATGKSIARGGKSEGHVPGATEKKGEEEK